MPQILDQAISKSPHIERSLQQQQYRSRLRSKAKALLQWQAQGKRLVNRQQRIVRRWQRFQWWASAQRGES